LGAHSNHRVDQRLRMALIRLDWGYPRFETFMHGLEGPLFLLHRSVKQRPLRD
jgi:hypothetical protein